MNGRAQAGERERSSRGRPLVSGTKSAPKAAPNSDRAAYSHSVLGEGTGGTKFENSMVFNFSMNPRLWGTERSVDDFINESG